MSSGGHDFVEWKEEFVSQERGSRVVHYFLKDLVGNSFLAVVGNERSLRHMVYVVSDEFLSICGSDKSNNNTCSKWRSRREVVDWLTSLLSKQRSSQDYSKSPTNESSQIWGTATSVTGNDDHGSYVHNHKGHFARVLKGHNWDIVWSGASWTCGKQLRHYPAFSRNGTTIAVHSFVLVMAKEENHYLAYLEDMYEDKKGRKKVKVRWFHQNQEVACTIPPPTPHPREVFITPYAQVISAECVDGLTTVLTPEHYGKCMVDLQFTSSVGIHLCFRQYISNRIKPFDLTKLRGYFDQVILSYLDMQSLTGEEDEEFSHGGAIKKGPKRTRSCRGRQRFVTDRSDVRVLGPVSQITSCGPAYQNLRFGLPGRRPLAVKYIGSQHLVPHPFKVDEKVELLCQDSGIRGCWFRCTVLQVSRKRLMVQYDDLQNEDGCGNVEEWIPAFRPAAPDKLGMRCSGRLTIRPCVPFGNLTDITFEIGTPVDAWWSDGWWEGVITRVECGDDGLQVYFPGEDLFSVFQRRNLRISRDWVGNRWINIEVKPDILSAISTVSPGPKLSACSTIVAESGGSAMSDREVPTTTTNPASVEEDKILPGGLGRSNIPLLENLKWMNTRKRQWIEDGFKRDDDGDHGHGHGDDGRDENDDDDEDEDGKLVAKEDGGSNSQTCEAVDFMEVDA